MRYSKYQEDRYQAKPSIHPIWNGIGCVLFVLLPIIAFMISTEVLRAGSIQQYVDIPRAMLQPYTIPGTGLTLPYFQASLAATAVTTVMLYAIMFVIYAALYRVVGPSRFGPTDSPPLKRKATKKSR